MSNTVVITSGKGGVGKTTVTANLGYALARRGVNTLLIDGDVGLNNLDVALGMENRGAYDMADVMAGKCRVSQAILQVPGFPLYIMPSAHAVYSEQIKAGGELSSLLARLNVSIEDYPELKADGQFHRLQANIEEMELQLQAVRRTYNAAVTDYNNAIEMFPSSIIAAWRRHTQEELIEIPEEEKQPVSVADLFRS